MYKIMARNGRDWEPESVQTSTTAVNKSHFTLGRRIFISQSEHLTDSKKMLA